MSTFINTEIEKRGPGLPISLLVAVLFVGVQLVIFVPSAILSRTADETIYATPAPFNIISLIIGILLLAFLALDFWRWRQRGIKKAYYFAFAGTAILLTGILIFLARVAGLMGA